MQPAPGHPSRLYTRRSDAQVRAASSLNGSNCTNPFVLVYAPYNSPGKVGMMTFLGFLASCLCVSGLLAALAACRVRAVALKQAGLASALAASIHLQLPAASLAAAATQVPRSTATPFSGRVAAFQALPIPAVAWFLYTAMGIVCVVTALGTTRMQTDSRHGRGDVPGCNWAAFAQCECVHEPGRGAHPRKPRYPAFHSAVDFFDTRRQMVGLSRLAPHVILWPAILGGILLWERGSLLGYFFLMGLMLVYCVVIASLGLAIATWVSRLGRAVAICVAIVIGFSIGWCFLIASLFNRDYLGIPLIMGSPLYRYGSSHERSGRRMRVDLSDATSGTPGQAR